VDFDWNFYLSTAAGVGAITFLVWLLWPTSTYRAARGWERSQYSRKYNDWIEYRTFKRSLSPLTIAMKATKSPTFSQTDLKKLNELFAKLEQPPAEPVEVDVGTPFDPSTMEDVTPEFVVDDGTRYVLENHGFGVFWNDDFLKKTPVTKCTADRLMLHRIDDANKRCESVAREFLNFIFRDGPLPPEFTLGDAKVKSFISMHVSDDQAVEVFSSMLDCHPESDFDLICPVAGHPFNNDTMTSADGQPGQRCRVASVLRPGFQRKSDKTWRIKALVTIRNISRNEE